MDSELPIELLTGDEAMMAAWPLSAVSTEHALGLVPWLRVHVDGDESVWVRVVAPLPTAAAASAAAAV